MNETLIKELIKYKLGAAETIVDHLPKTLSAGLKELGQIVFEGINERYSDNTDKFSRKPADKLNSVPIE
ncbi:hypothetical protein MFMK1_001627 [Metallumcola ferriviriculae]|uniref:Uncharacterized protein n=1 Tax=Metallumcola ferriviriculae TaxID=3039180 RepID=A0AAU0UL33_9FIRM|nr:hypothetical protein MFMK1_001627 [Desulfitibacteraceae bacterium MK1]